MAYFLVEFMKADCVGFIATRHKILADQEPDGTHASDCKQLAELHSTAVDYSKTGVPIYMKLIPAAGRFRPDLYVFGSHPRCQGQWLTRSSMALGSLAQVYIKSKIMLTELSSHAAYEEDCSTRILYYKSDRILEKLYRAINDKRTWYEHVNTGPSPNEDAFWARFISHLTSRHSLRQPDSCVVRPGAFVQRES